MCPGGKTLTTTGTLVNDDATMLYRASKHDRAGCALRLTCCPDIQLSRCDPNDNGPGRSRSRFIYKDCFVTRFSDRTVAGEA